MASRTRATRKEELQQVTRDYRAAGEPWPASTNAIAAWAIRTQRARYSPKSQVQLLAREIQSALRQEYYTDPQGRRVRKKHAYSVQSVGPDGPTQKTFWCDIESDKPDLVHLSLQQRRRQIVGDCSQLKIDKDSFNDNNSHGATIQLSFNFEPDLIELELDQEYNPPPLEEEI